jgi:hypothetical protein
MDQNNINYVAESGQHHYSPVGMGLIGMVLGWLLSKTRFGQWYEASPVVGFLYWLLITAFKLFLVFCCCYFLYLLFFTA